MKTVDHVARTTEAAAYSSRRRRPSLGRACPAAGHPNESGTQQTQKLFRVDPGTPLEIGQLCCTAKLIDLA